MSISRGEAGKQRFYRIIEEREELEETLKKAFHDSKKLPRQQLLQKYSKDIVEEMEAKYKKKETI